MDGQLDQLWWVAKAERAVLVFVDCLYQTRPERFLFIPLEGREDIETMGTEEVFSRSTALVREKIQGMLEWVDRWIGRNVRRSTEISRK